MRLQDVIPYMVCVNLAPREDRRREAWGRFAAAGLAVDRQPGILKRTVADPRGFKNAARYSCSLAKRLAIRRAKLAGAPAVLLFEDDVVLAADLHERLAEIELPEDWGIFFLGCKHLERPEIIAPGLVKVTRAADHHAMAIRADFFDAAIRGLAGYGKGSPHRVDYSDVKMSEIQAWVPTYAAFPNLAWQALPRSQSHGCPPHVEPGSPPLVASAKWGCRKPPAFAPTASAPTPAAIAPSGLWSLASGILNFASTAPNRSAVTPASSSRASVSFRRSSRRPRLIQKRKGKA